MAWSQQQDKCLVDVLSWRKNPRGQQVFRIMGFAGTGKTTLLLAIAAMFENPMFAAFTGKAALVMRSKGCEDASTIHSLIYTPVEDDEGYIQFVLNHDSALNFADVLIVDEVSMVGEELGRDLLSFGRPILVVGDPGQLPPITSAGFFTHGPDCTPDVMLTEVHRQAADNPIIAMATLVRSGGRLNLGNYGDSRVISSAVLKDETKTVLDADQLIVGRNSTRHAWNKRVRKLHGYNPDRPVKNEKLICLKNSSRKGLLNGSMWNVEKVAKKGESFNLWVNPIDMPPRKKATAVRVRREFFAGEEAQLEAEDKKYHDEFAYGHAITCHKSQGSQWDRIVVKDESGVFRDDASRWLYTAITRAAISLTIAI